MRRTVYHNGYSTSRRVHSIWRGVAALVLVLAFPLMFVRLFPESLIAVPVVVATIIIATAHRRS